MVARRWGTTGKGREMRRHTNTYAGYSIACAVVWAAILAVASFAADSATRHKLVMVCGGWAIGWLSATIARSVYPPPKRHSSQPMGNP